MPGSEPYVFFNPGVASFAVLVVGLTGLDLRAP